MTRNLTVRATGEPVVLQIDTPQGAMLIINDTIALRMIEVATGVTRFVYRYQKRVNTYAELHKAMSTCETVEECKRMLLMFASQEEMAHPA